MDKFGPSIEHERPYWETIRQLEVKMFPAFKQGYIYAPENSKSYFAPSWHFRTELVTESDVNNFSSDDSQTLLSIGSGPAYLERLLTELGINKGNITLSDIDSKNLPSDFKAEIFDMYAEWPNFKDENFDLIIFPESSLLNVNFGTDQERQAGLYHLITQVLPHLKPSGEMRINGHCQPDWNIEAVKQRINRENRKKKITHTNDLIGVKNETMAS